MDKINVLLLSKNSDLMEMELPPYIVMEYSESELQPGKKHYEIILIDRTPSQSELYLLQKITSAYTLFVTEKANIKQCDTLMKNRQGTKLQSKHIPELLQKYGIWFFHQSYGEKYDSKNMSVSSNFTGDIQWQGNYWMELTGEFGSEMRQIVFWKNNIPIEKYQTIDFWLEYEKTAGVEICMKAYMLASGELSRVIDTVEFSEEQMKQPVQIYAPEKIFVFVAIHAKGSGTLKIRSLHDRYSRGPFGYFLPGGERFVTSEREEIFCYFDPGDRKPPLNVYFSGYKTKEGFEGYGIMRKMGAPFLLVSESRLEGGSFYVGSPEYEKLMVSVLQKYLDKLGFKRSDLILSGISMGSTGALYYGCDLRPHAIIVGKPLVNLGTIALNEKLSRPGGFPTSLDLLLKQCGEANREAAGGLDQRFWKKLEKTDWSDTKLIMSYMMEDDYDKQAYDDFIKVLSVKNAHIYGRGLHGRHNDNTIGIVQWFISQYRKIIREDFSQYYSKSRQENNA